MESQHPGGPGYIPAEEIVYVHVHIEDVLPVIPWLPRYNRHYLKADLFAGLTVAVVALPQSMAYAIIAGPG